MSATRMLLFAAVTVALCASCGHNKRATKTVLTRASYDFDCPEDQLELTVLDTGGARKMATQIGAEGCGKKAVYVYFASTDTWVSNTGITEAMVQQEADYQEKVRQEDQEAEEQRRMENQNYQRGIAE